MRKLSNLTDCILAAALALAPRLAPAQEDWDDALEEPDFRDEAVADEEPADFEESLKRKAAEADARFDAVMQQNAPVQAQGELFGMGNIPAQVQTADRLTPQVEVPLDRYGEVRARLEALREQAARWQGPAVVLGGASYSGEAQSGGLALRVELQITLGHPGRFKVVPLAGDGVVLARATVDGRPLPVSRQSGYHVWVTDRTGEVTAALELLVPPKGRRGSIEYDFLVPRTPVTRFACRFPVGGLEPRLSAAVHSEVRSAAGSTHLSSTLRPTTRIHLVGFRDLGESESRQAKIYAESLGLLSVDEGAIDLFTVIRYTILYAGTKEFQVLVPPGMSVVAADGEGAFSYELEKTDAGTLVKGETAFPIRNSYEISLRLHRDAARGAEAFDVPLPRTLGVEREHGWLAVEVPGKLKLEEQERHEMLAVDVRQLPGEMVQSAVSPILKAYRYHAATARLRLEAVRLPEKEPASSSIDQVHATSVLSTDGKLLTDLRITLRNRLRNSLAVQVPAGVEVRSTLLDGRPAKPSRDASGRLMLPLKRSAGGDSLEPFTLQVVLEGEIGAMGVIGAPALGLPAFELPVSSLVWTLHLPAKNAYSRLRGDLEPQTYVGTASWHRAAVVQPTGAMLSERVAQPALAAPSADTGAMPVRIEIPKSGKRVQYARYWIEADQPVRISFTYVLGWLLLPSALLMGVALIAAALVATSGRAPTQRRRRALAAGLAAALVAMWALARLAGPTALVLGGLAALLAVAARKGLLPEALQRACDWAHTLGPRFRDRERDTEWGFWRVLWKLALGLGMAIFGLLVLTAALQLVDLLFTPLA